MNTTQLTQRFVAFTLAAVVTVAMLAGIEGLAVSDAPQALIARVVVTQPA